VYILFRLLDDNTTKLRCECDYVHIGYSDHGISLNQIIVVVAKRSTFCPLYSFSWQLFMIIFRAETLV